MADNPIENILKVREENTPLVFEQTEKGGAFSIIDNQLSSSWLTTNKPDGITLSDLRSGIEPWLTSLFQSEHLSLLTGTGLSVAVQFLASSLSGISMVIPTLDTEYADKIMVSANNIAEKNNRGCANIEDTIRVMNELLKGLEVLGYDTAEDRTKEKKAYIKLRDNLEKIISDFANSISEIENGIATTAEEKRNEAFDYLVNFLMSFASRTGT